tara:strand:- start:2044 stop:2466 length:423 start_codon:yes stop_codon:yes gene_type:complete
MTIFAISIALIICIGLPVSGLIITSKQLSRREADYQLLRKHYTENFFRLEELEKTHDSMRLRGDLWEGKYGKLKVDYKELRKKHDNVVKEFDDYHRRAMESEARWHDMLEAENVRAELEAIKEACTPIYEDIAEWESKKL